MSWPARGIYILLRVVRTLPKKVRDKKGMINNSHRSYIDVIDNTQIR